jgi:hypothetical protein
MQLEERMFREHLGGASLRQIGDRYGYGKTTVARMIDSALDELVLTTIVDLYCAWRDEQAGGEGKYPAFLIPAQDQTDRQVALRVVDLVRSRLVDRCIPVKTILKNVPPSEDTPGAQIFMLTLDQDELDRRDAAREGD